MKIDDIPDTGEGWAACACTQPIYVMDRYVTDHLWGWPRYPSLVQFYRYDGGDPDDLIAECPACDAWLQLENMIIYGEEHHA